MEKILIVDDERVLREGMKRLLTGEGFDVCTARTGEEALGKVTDERPDLVLLDVMMPKMNGFRICEEIRRMNALLPVLFLTAKDSEADQVRGIGLGADDYISKRTGEAALIARIRRALGRARDIAVSRKDCVFQRIRLGRVDVDLQSLQVMAGGKTLACLTKTESDLLRVLFAKRGQGLTVDELVGALRGQGYACEDTLVYTHVCRLRQKLGPAGALITNVRGVGYRLIR